MGLQCVEFLYAAERFADGKLGFDVKQLYVVQKETAKLIVGVRHFTPRRADHP
jgi:hypothetical protein